MASEHGSLEGLGLAVLVWFEIPNMYSGLLPSLFTISTFTGGDEAKREHAKRWIRRGEIQATAMSLVLGAAASALARKPWPFLGSLVMCGYLLWQYESALSGGESGPGLDMRAGAR